MNNSSSVLLHSADVRVAAVRAEKSGHPVPLGVCLHQSDLLRVPASQGTHQESPGALRAGDQHDGYVEFRDSFRLSKASPTHVPIKLTR